MNRLWQVMPSMAFKLGLYEPAISIRELRRHGDFGVGQFAALDGELTVLGGEFYRALADGSVSLAKDDDTLCFAQLTFFKPECEWDCSAMQDAVAFEAFLHSHVLFPNDFWVFELNGSFVSIVPTAPPAMTKPYPPFAQAVKFRESFATNNVEGTIVGIYSPSFSGDTGIPGFHYHLISADRKISGHVTSFSLAQGRVRVSRLRETVLLLPDTAEFAALKIGP